MNTYSKEEEKRNKPGPFTPIKFSTIHPCVASYMFPLVMEKNVKKKKIFLVSSRFLSISFITKFNIIFSSFPLEI